MSHYTHLSIEERECIYLKHGLGESARQIAEAIGRSPSTVTRELKRGWSPEQIRHRLELEQNPLRIPSVDKGKHGFSGHILRLTALSSSPGVKPGFLVCLVRRKICSRKTPKDPPASKNRRWEGSGRRRAAARRGR